MLRGFTSVAAPKTTIQETIPQATAPAVTVPIDLKHEMVSGGQGIWYGTAARSLPWPIDDITLAFGDDLYNRMMTDAIVSSAVNIFKASILADGVSLTSAIDDKDHEGYQQAADLVDWCNLMLEDMEPDLDSVLFNMLDAIQYGNKVGELIYDTDSTYTGKVQIALRALHVKPRHAVAFVVDPYKSLLGVLGLFPGQNVWPLTGIQIPDLANVENFVQAEKFCILTSRMEDNDPRGTSILRGAYDPWWRKEQAKSKHLQFLAVFAMASLIGFLPKGARPTARLNPDNTPVFDGNGNPVFDFPADVMLTALEKFQNASIAVFPDGSPDGSRVQVVPAQGTGEPFVQAFTVHDREIIKAILTATLASDDGEHATRAQASVHQDAQQTLIGQAKKSVCQMLRRQMLRRLVTYNYGAVVARRLTPKVSLGGTDSEDIAAVWTAVAALAKSGYLDASQLAALDVRVSLPERSVATTDVDAADDTSPDPASQPPAVPGQQPPAPGTQPPPAQPGTPPAPTPAKPPATAPAQQERKAA